MKTIPGKNPGRYVEIAMAVYSAIGIAIIQKTFDVYGLIFSGSCGLLTLAAVMLDEKTDQKFGDYDSWGWSKAATKGLLVAAVILFVGGLPLWQRLINSYFSAAKSLVIPYWVIAEIVFFGLMMGLAVYWRAYLKPVENEITNPKSLELEHREWLALFQVHVIFAGIFFIATGYSYLTGMIEETPLSHQAKMTSLFFLTKFFYVAVSYLTWILRPLYGRGKEIRDHLNKLKQEENSSKHWGAKNET